jgi:rhodanese-related sulfurtransferase
MSEQTPLQAPLRVSVDGVMKRIARGERIVFLDTRSPRSWSESTEQIRGAIRVPPDEVPAHLNGIPEGQSLVTYCT